jgi:RNA polymerase sigma-54 factor
MKQTLTLKLGQHLTMTPQLQQAIRLLQLSTLDLQLEIQQAIESNPMLELDEDDVDGIDESDELDPDSVDPLTDKTTEADEDAGDESDPDDPYDQGHDPDADTDGPQADDEWQEEIPEELPVDSSWDDVYQPALPPMASGSDDYGNEERNGTQESLADHLAWQLNLTPMSDTDLVIGTAIIEAVNADGMMTQTVDDLLQGFDPELEIEPDEVEAVLKRIQQFDPPGVAARDLSESLLIQLRQLNGEHALLAEAKALVADHLDLLAAHDFAALRRKTRLAEDELRSVIDLIQSLNPRPGSGVGADETQYVIPDILVRKKKGRWLVELNPDSAPRVRINSDYAGLVKRADNSADNQFLKNNLQEARWFLKSLHSRNETLLKVGTRIVEHQRGFLEYGEEAMKPLVLHDIAEAVDMHESTISRVTTRKYMHTPRGVFELKYFFSSHVGTNTGGEVSSTAIRALIKKLTADENPRKPLSDSKIAAILAEQNIRVARRTVAKYRDLLSIPPSNERKRLV